MSFWDHSFQELFLKGGPVMWPLLAFSVMALALILDRALVHISVRLDLRGFVASLRVLVEEGKLEEARRRCRSTTHPAARVVTAYLDHIDSDAAVRVAVVEREGSLALESIERRQRGLAVLATTSTLLGLLGTVTGLVTAFQQIEVVAGPVRPEVLASGIWAALLTTVFGLAIAIPCTLAYHYFDARAGRLEHRLEFMVSYLDEWNQTRRVSIQEGRG